MAVTVVSGVPGVGSTRVTEAARKRLDDDYRVFNFGDLMLEESIARGTATSRDELSELSVREQITLQRRAAEEIRDAAHGGGHDVIVDTHFVLNTGSGYLPGLPLPVLREVGAARFVLVEAAPSIIEERRSGEEDYRDYYDTHEAAIEFHQQMNRMAAVAYASYASAPIHRVDNEGTVEEAGEELAAIVSGD